MRRTVKPDARQNNCALDFHTFPARSCKMRGQSAQLIAYVGLHADRRIGPTERDEQVEAMQSTC
jgi:hypothetical protein